MPTVARIEVVHSTDLSAEEPVAERAVSYETDAEFAQHRWPSP